ncbi:PREDICTED: cardioacceleratory peptide receptor [Nicrophorus vespilloides]|uniref:Cardioacceleratory peptide receptor n=1 Tax=Nicrophorus vespilloides TaxID=110193 RepID=A0ABM1M2L1_NICVS|nr:PREDICTED: cardioacceleratory peptide receptor [Nicrophorus vespilloides]
MVNSKQMDLDSVDVITGANGTDDGRNSSDSDNALDSFYFYEVEQFTVLWVLLVVIVVGNAAVLLTLYYTKSRKSRMNFFISHLAVADLAVGLINVLTDLVWKMTVSWNAGNVACKVVRFMQVVVTYASTYVLVALSIDRYDAIRHPMKFSGSWKRAKCLIITAWLLSVLFSTPILILYEEKIVQGAPQCWIELPSQVHWQVYMCLVSVSLFLIPALIIASCYTIIIATIWSKSSISVTKSNCKGLDTRRVSSRGLIPRAKVKTVKITFVIVSVFILCWSPYIVFDLLQVFDCIPPTQTNIAIATLIQSLAPLNSAANPIIYFVFSTRICNRFCDIPPFRWFRCLKMGQNDFANNTQSSSLSEFLTSNTRRTISRPSQSVLVSKI